MPISRFTNSKCAIAEKLLTFLVERIFRNANLGFILFLNATATSHLQKTIVWRIFEYWTIIIVKFSSLGIDFQICKFVFPFRKTTIFLQGMSSNTNIQRNEKFKQKIFKVSISIESWNIKT